MPFYNISFFDSDRIYFKPAFDQLDNMGLRAGRLFSLDYSSSGKGIGSFGFFFLVLLADSVLGVSFSADLVSFVSALVSVLAFFSSTLVSFFSSTFFSSSTAFSLTNFMTIFKNPNLTLLKRPTAL